MAVFDVAGTDAHIPEVGVAIGNATDLAGNEVHYASAGNLLRIDIEGSGIAETPGPSNAPVYPNPIAAGGQLHFRIARTFVNGRIRLLDAQGRAVVEQQAGLLLAGTQAWTMPDIAAGTYRLLIEDARGAAQWVVQAMDP
jgi:hypothetical protein